MTNIRPNLKTAIYIPLAALLLTFLAYTPILNNQFTYYSDDVYVLKNPLIQQLSISNLSYIFTSYFDGHYHPLTLLSLMLTYSIAGEQPFLYQLTNLLLHLCNTFLVYRFVVLLHCPDDRPPVQQSSPNLPYIIAGTVALLFGLHTLHVESVARITERKDMLFSAFLLLSLCQYLRYLQTTKKSYYWQSILLFFLSLLSKGQAVALAPTLLLLDWYHQRSLQTTKIWVEKIPFFALALLFGILNLLAQRYTGYVLSYDQMPFYEPFVDASYVLTHYLFKNLLPIHLSAFYPYPNAIGEPLPASMWCYLSIWAAIGGILYAVRQHKIMTFGILFYLIHIILMIRILPIADNIMPDRYNYVPSIGILLLLVIATQKLHTIFNNKLVFTALIAYSLLLFTLTFSRCQVWYNGETVWKNALQQYPQVSQLWQNLGDAHLNKQHIAEGINALQKAIALDPQNMLAYLSLYNANIANKNPDAAQQYLQVASKIPVNTTINLSNRGTIQSMLQQNDLALADFKTALQLDPYQAKIYFNLAVLYFQQGNITAAETYLQRVIELRPMFIIEALIAKGRFAIAKNDWINAQKSAQQCLKLQSNNTNALLQLAEIHYKIKLYSKAQQYLQQAKSLGAIPNPDLEQAILQKNSP